MPHEERAANFAGRGAAVVEPPGSNVYVVRSQRSGGVSIGVDLTPEGACPLACDYCQVPREGKITRLRRIDLAALARELQSARARHPEAVDIAFAGSGEPTWSPFFVEALDVARWVARDPHIPVRVLTSGATLDRRSVRDALERLVNEGAGEVWIKLDAWDESSVARIWGVHGQAKHEARIARFASRAPIVLQCLVASRANGPSADETGAGLARAVERLLQAGARIHSVTLGTLLRPPGRPSAIEPYGASTLRTIADALHATGVRVTQAGRARLGLA